VSKKQEARSGKQEAGSKKREARSGKQEAGSKKREAGSGKQEKRRNSEQKKQKKIIPLGSIATRGAVNSEQ
jgi:hypothetical protein